jgi:hypothetical protein
MLSRDAEERNERLLEFRKSRRHYEISLESEKSFKQISAEFYKNAPM